MKFPNHRIIISKHARRRYRERIDDRDDPLPETEQAELSVSLDLRMIAQVRTGRLASARELSVLRSRLGGLVIINDMSGAAFVVHLKDRGVVVVSTVLRAVGDGGGAPHRHVRRGKTNRRRRAKADG